MNIINNMLEALKEGSGINNEYFLLIILSISIILIIKVIGKAINKVYNLKRHSSKKTFRFNQSINIISNIICVFLIFLVWEKHLSNVITIISFISAGATIALREVILNIFAGIYIKTSKPFVVEDRVQIGDIKGDVVLITALSFKVLELKDRLNGEQSSGIIVNIPNSKVFSQAVKNYTAAFKYIWSELVVMAPCDADIDKNKKKLYEIVNRNEVIKSIPQKMDRAIHEASGSYRIYYNNLKPIIYTEFKDGHIEFTIRFLVHPKKERNVINDLWINIIKEYQKNNLDLYRKI